MTEQLELGAVLKEQGMATADASTDEWWRECCDRAIEDAARSGREFQSWDLVRLYGLPEPRDHHQWGPRFSAAASRGVIEWVRYEKSARPNTRRSVLSVWRGTESAAVVGEYEAARQSAPTLTPGLTHPHSTQPSKEG